MNKNKYIRDKRNKELIGFNVLSYSYIMVVLFNELIQTLRYKRMRGENIPLVLISCTVTIF